MTIIEAIAKINNIKPNSFTQDQKIGWLSTLDGMIKRFVIDTHEGGEDIIFNGYDADSINTELLVPAPFDGIYMRWLEAQMDYANGEYGKYNNAIITYNTEYEAFANYYNRTHMPKAKGTRFKF